MKFIRDTCQCIRLRDQGVGFPNIRGIFLGGPIIRIIVFWSPYWGLITSRNYHTCLYAGYVGVIPLGAYREIGRW